ncbi:hypothetical protein WBP_0183 [Wolbachia endosymbiont of Brugia pahangi]|nr:hypothetical protein WBP_0183 [Wolbachia endosymbiont of Brugia pahangi]
MLVRGSEYYNTGSMNIEGKYASMIRGSVRHSLQLNHTYEEMSSQKAGTQFAYNKHIYEKMDGFEIMIHSTVATLA